MILAGAFTLTLLYTIYLVTLRIAWINIPVLSNESNESEYQVSVIIPVRNEAKHILSLLTDFELQTFPREQFEILVVDDYSQDQTVNLVKGYIPHSKLAIRVISLDALDAAEGKKSAITQGVKAAKNEIILCTDGDCTVPKYWIEQYAHQFSDPEVQMVLGPVRFLEGNTTFNRMQQLEFAGLIGLGGASLQLGLPTMCNGANLGYRKSLFNSVRGYEGNQDIASGDDEFLLQKAFDENPKSVRFLKSSKAIVGTFAKKSFSSFLSQRIRWAGKWKYHKQLRVIIWAISMFLFHIALLMSGLGISLLERPEIGLGIIMIKILAEYFYIKSVSNSMKLKVPIKEFLLIQLIYPFYIVFLSLISLFVNYRWKGRSY